MSKLSTHQIIAMLDKLDSTIAQTFASDNRTGERKHANAIAKHKAYSEELAAREAQEAEESHSQAGTVCGNCEGTGSVLLASGSIRCDGCAGTGRTQLEPRARVQEIRRPEPPPPEPPTAEPDDDLTLMCRAILTRYTLGTVSDELWRVEGQLFGTLTQPRVTRTKARTA